MARPEGRLVQGPQPDELLLTDASPWTRTPSRPVVMVAAFAIGLCAAAAAYAIHASWGADGRESVMIDRQASRPRPQQKAARESVLRAEALVPVAAAAPDAHDPPTDRMTVASAPARRSFDRVLSLADALDHCAGEPVFARLACEARARTRYCEGAAASIPQCADSTSR